MRKTYAYNSIIIGFLVGLLVGVSSDSAVLAVLAGLGVAIVGFIVIRVIENAINAGVDKAADKVKEAYSKHKQKTMPASAVVPPATTQMPGSTQAAQRTTSPSRRRLPPRQHPRSQRFPVLTAAPRSAPLPASALPAAAK